MNNNKTRTSTYKTKVDNRKAKLQKVIDNTPEHTRNLVYLVKNNAEIRRFTSLGIINVMKQRGMIDKNAKVSVEFYFNKYSVAVNGLRQEYTYNNEIFIRSLSAAFVSFAYNADNVIREYLRVENTSIDTDEVAKLSEETRNNFPVEEETTETASE